jgi:hypothetical protein
MQNRTWDSSTKTSVDSTLDKDLPLNKGQGVSQNDAPIDLSLATPVKPEDTSIATKSENNTPLASASKKKPLEETEIKEGSIFSRPSLYKSSKKVLIPFLGISALFIVLSFFPEILISLFFSDADMQELVDQFPSVAKYLPVISTYLLYGLSIFLTYLGFKEINGGSLQIFGSYVIHKQGFLKKTKIHFENLASIEVHKAVFSGFMDIGHLELSSTQKDINIKNLDKPFEIKEMILISADNYLKSKKN